MAIGISSSPLVARLLARQALPQGILVCPPGSELDELASKPVDALPGLSGPVPDKLRKYRLLYVHQIKRLDRRSLAKRLGLYDGAKLYGMVRGIGDPTPREKTPAIVARTVLRSDLNDEYLLTQCVYA